MLTHFLLKCCRAFARSPQFWSSYVAFARDIVKMCSSLSRWQDTAIIKNLYRNMTSMQSDFLKGILQESENRLARDSEEQKKHQQRQKTTDTAINNLENTTEVGIYLMNSKLKWLTERDSY